MRVFWIVLVALLAGLLGQAAWAAKPAVITKIAGKAYVLRADPSSAWIAAWSEQTNGTYKLVAINGDNGDHLDVDTAKQPGGICWIPGMNRLLYCKGAYQDKLKNTMVTYYYYDIAAKASTKIRQINDLLQTYQLDPLAADDGAIVFALTIDTLSSPSFDIYYPQANSMSENAVPANIGSEYDLSSDGSLVYWYLHDPKDGKFYIVSWSLGESNYADLYEYASATDPAEDHALFKLDSPNSQAATIAYNQTDPTLQLCVYGFRDPNKLTIAPVRLGPGEVVQYFDWKGRSGTLYALVKNTKSADYSIEEIEPLTGARVQLLHIKDPIAVVDYSPKTQAYYYTTVDERDKRKPLTMIVRLK